MSSDPSCAVGAGQKPLNDAVLVAADGSLQNAFVYIKDGLDPAYTFETPSTPVVLDQKGCFFVPRVMGLRVGQPLELANTDPTFHNIHAMPKENREFNHGLAPGVPPDAAHVHDAGSHGPLQMRRARMDGGAHRRDGPSLLRGDGR